MKGILVKVRRSFSNSYSFDGSHNLWPLLKEWNILNENSKILLKNGVFANSVTENLLKYFYFVKKSTSLDYRNSPVYWYGYVQDDIKPDIYMISINMQPEGFDFIGYDCGYIDYEEIGNAEENNESLFFSFLQNDFRSLQNQVVFGKYFSKLNM